MKNPVMLTVAHSFKNNILLIPWDIQTLYFDHIYSSLKPTQIHFHLLTHEILFFFLPSLPVLYLIFFLQSRFYPRPGSPSNCSTSHTFPAAPPPSVGSGLFIGKGWTMLCASWVPTFRTERQIPPDVGCVCCSKSLQNCCQETASCSKKYYFLQTKPITSTQVAFLNWNNWNGHVSTQHLHVAREACITCFFIVSVCPILLSLLNTYVVSGRLFPREWSWADYEIGFWRWNCWRTRSE